MPLVQVSGARYSRKIAKRPQDKRWVNYLLGLVNAQRKKLDKVIAATTDFNKRLGIVPGECIGLDWTALV